MTTPATSTDLSASDQIFHSARFRWCIYILLLTVTAGQNLAAILNSAPLQSANDRSRWCTVWSLVERGTYQIDTINEYSRWASIDKVRHENHFYSSKPPLYPTLVAGLYWLIKTTTGLNLNQDLNDVTHLILIAVNLIPMLLALMLICRMVELYARADLTRYFVVVSACFATLLTPFLLTLNNHSIAASSAVFTLYPLLRILVDGQQKKRYFLLAGFFAMFTCCNELPAALFGLITFGLLFKANPRLTLLVFSPAALVPLIGFFVTNYAATGGWKPFYMYYGTEKYLYEHKGVPSYWKNPQGLDRNLDSPLVYFFHCALGHHGIFSLSPIYLLTLFSWFRIRQAAQHKLRPLLWVSLALTVIVFGFYMTRTGNYNYGGNSSALRWMLWLTPFWLLSMIPLLDQLSSKRWLQIGGVICLLLSVFSAHYPQSNPWQAPWIFSWFKEAGWIQYDQRPPAFKRPHSSWIGSIPEPTPAVPEPFVEFTGPANDGRLIRLRINVVKPDNQQEASQKRRTIQVTRHLGSEETQSSRYTIDVAAFDAGKWPEEFLVWPDENVSQAEKYAAYRFFYGMPRRRAYNPGKIRHLFTPVRADAYRCQLAASQVKVTIAADTQAEKKLRYRTDLWLSDEIPFGVAQFETSVYDSKEGQLLSRQTMIVTSASSQTAVPPAESP